jgi:hypothetical protein
MASKPNTTATLENARKALAVLVQEGVGLSDARDKSLLEGVSAAEISKLDKQIEVNRHAAATEKDRIALFEKKLAEEECEAERRRHEQHVEEFAKTLEQADCAADELQASAMVLEETFRRVIELRERALSMFPFGRSSHADAAARAIEGCALSGPAVAALLGAELHRIGSEPRLGGNPNEQIKVPLPGGTPLRLTPEVDRRTGRPLPVAPISEKLRAASRFAVSILRDGLFTPPVVEQPPVPVQVLGVEQPAPVQPQPRRDQQPQTPAPAPSAGNTTQEFVPVAYREKLATLLRLQMRLAAGNDDAAYEQCLKNLTALRLEIDAARDGEKSA